MEILFLETENHKHPKGGFNKKNRHIPVAALGFV